jgi:hypothetical protein
MLPKNSQNNIARSAADVSLRYSDYDLITSKGEFRSFDNIFGPTVTYSSADNLIYYIGYDHWPSETATGSTSKSDQIVNIDLDDSSFYQVNVLKRGSAQIDPTNHHDSAFKGSVKLNGDGDHLLITIPETGCNDGDDGTKPATQLSDDASCKQNAPIYRESYEYSGPESTKKNATYMLSNLAANDGEFTIEFWVKPEKLDEEYNYQTIIDFQSKDVGGPEGPTEHASFLHIAIGCGVGGWDKGKVYVKSAPMLATGLKDFGSIYKMEPIQPTEKKTYTVPSENKLNLTSTTLLSEGTWYHVAIVKKAQSGNDKVDLYINGTSEANQTWTNTVAANAITDFYGVDSKEFNYFPTGAGVEDSNEGNPDPYATLPWNGYVKNRPLGVSPPWYIGVQAQFSEEDIWMTSTPWGKDKRGINPEREDAIIMRGNQSIPDESLVRNVNFYGYFRGWINEMRFSEKAIYSADFAETDNYPTVPFTADDAIMETGPPSNEESGDPTLKLLLKAKNDGGSDSTFTDFTGRHTITNSGSVTKKIRSEGFHPELEDKRWIYFPFEEGESIACGSLSIPHSEDFNFQEKLTRIEMWVDSAQGGPCDSSTDCWLNRSPIMSKLTWDADGNPVGWALSLDEDHHLVLESWPHICNEVDGATKCSDGAIDHDYAWGVKTKDCTEAIWTNPTPSCPHYNTIEPMGVAGGPNVFRSPWLARSHWGGWSSSEIEDNCKDGNAYYDIYDNMYGSTQWGFPTETSGSIKSKLPFRPNARHNIVIFYRRAVPGANIGDVLPVTGNFMGYYGGVQPGGENARWAGGEAFEVYTGRNAVENSLGYWQWSPILFGIPKEKRLSAPPLHNAYYEKQNEYTWTDKIEMYVDGVLQGQLEIPTSDENDEIWNNRSKLFIGGATCKSSPDSSCCSAKNLYIDEIQWSSISLEDVWSTAKEHYGIESGSEWYEGSISRSHGNYNWFGTAIEQHIAYGTPLWWEEPPFNKFLPAQASDRNNHPWYQWPPEGGGVHGAAANGIIAQHSTSSIASAVRDSDYLCSPMIGQDFGQGSHTMLPPDWQSTNGRCIKPSYPDNAKLHYPDYDIGTLPIPFDGGDFVGAYRVFNNKITWWNLCYRHFGTFDNKIYGWSTVKEACEYANNTSVCYNGDYLGVMACPMSMINLNDEKEATAGCISFTKNPENISPLQPDLNYDDAVGATLNPGDVLYDIGDNWGNHGSWNSGEFRSGFALGGAYQAFMRAENMGSVGKSKHYWYWDDLGSHGFAWEGGGGSSAAYGTSDKNYFVDLDKKEVYEIGRGEVNNQELTIVLSKYQCPCNMTAATYPSTHEALTPTVTGSKPANTSLLLHFDAETQEGESVTEIKAGNYGLCTFNPLTLQTQRVRAFDKPQYKAWLEGGDSNYRHREYSIPKNIIYSPYDNNLHMVFLEHKNIYERTEGEEVVDGEYTGGRGTANHIYKTQAKFKLYKFDIDQRTFSLNTDAGNNGVLSSYAWKDDEISTGKYSDDGFRWLWKFPAWLHAMHTSIGVNPRSGEVISLHSKQANNVGYGKGYDGASWGSVLGVDQNIKEPIFTSSALSKHGMPSATTHKYFKGYCPSGNCVGNFPIAEGLEINTWSTFWEFYNREGPWMPALKQHGNLGIVPFNNDDYQSNNILWFSHTPPTHFELNGGEKWTEVGAWNPKILFCSTTGSYHHQINEYNAWYDFIYDSAGGKRFAGLYVNLVPTELAQSATIQDTIEVPSQGKMLYLVRLQVGDGYETRLVYMTPCSPNWPQEVPGTKAPAEISGGKNIHEELISAYPCENVDYDVGQAEFVKIDVSSPESLIYCPSNDRIYLLGRSTLLQIIPTTLEIEKRYVAPTGGARMPSTVGSGRSEVLRSFTPIYSHSNDTIYYLSNDVNAQSFLFEPNY